MKVARITIDVQRDTEGRIAHEHSVSGDVEFILCDAIDDAIQTLLATCLNQMEGKDAT